jgi:hypothetical protein
LPVVSNPVLAKFLSSRNIFQAFVPLGVFLDFITTTIDISKFGISREHSLVVRALFSSLGPVGLVAWFLIELGACFGTVAGLGIMGRKWNVHPGIVPSVFLGMFVFVAFVNMSSFISQ